ncbi:MAG: Phosphate-binding protein PstS [Elusimicrobia bacterium]|nr:Phosphate-binding protein PstS [Elusimicrobiota bacterium]
MRNLKKLSCWLRIFGAATVFLSATSQALTDTRLNGAGATFPYPIYSKWFDEYQKKYPEVQINYQSIGSGGGIRQLIAKTIDFGATDKSMSDSEMAKVDGKTLHIPTVVGGVVPAFNLPGIENLNFTGPILADIFLGKITTWDDSAIAALNPGIDLPDTTITVVHRSDGSGTTFCFTDYLAKISEEWQQQVGTGMSVNWPIGIGGKGNEGVAGLVRQSPNSLGYVELVYAKHNNIPFGAVKNKRGKFIKATVETLSAAAASTRMPVDFRVSITDADGENSYPISTYTWLLLNERNRDGKGAVLKEFLYWMLNDGQSYVTKLDFAPLPTEVNAMVREAIGIIQ